MRWLGGPLLLAIVAIRSAAAPASPPEDADVAELAADDDSDDGGANDDGGDADQSIRPADVGDHDRPDDDTDVDLGKNADDVDDNAKTVSIDGVGAKRCRLGLAAFAAQDPSDGALAAQLTALSASALSERSGCEVVVAPSCVGVDDVACAVAVAGFQGAKAVLLARVGPHSDAAKAELDASLRDADGVALQTRREAFDRKRPARAADDAVAALITAIDVPGPGPAPLVFAPPTSAVAANDPAEVDASGVAPHEDRRPLLFGGIGVLGAGALVAGAGAFLLGDAAQALASQDGNADAALEEQFVGGVVAAAGAAVAVVGIVIVTAAVVGADDDDDDDDGSVGDGSVGDTDGRGGP